MINPEVEYTESDHDHLDFLQAIQSAVARAINDRHEVIRLRYEAEYFKNKYQECLDSSIKHGDAMMANLLKATINGKIKG